MIFRQVLREKGNGVHFIYISLSSFIDILLFGPMVMFLFQGSVLCYCDEAFRKECIRCIVCFKGWDLSCDGAEQYMANSRFHLIKARNIYFCKGSQWRIFHGIYILITDAKQVIMCDIYTVHLITIEFGDSV